MQSTKLRITNLLLVTALLIIVFYPIFDIRFVTNDDAHIVGSDWFAPYTMAIKFGRIGFFVGGYLLQVPYWFDSQVYFFTAKVGAIIAVLGLLAHLIKVVSLSSALARLVFVTSLAFLANGWQHNAMNAYPFAFNAYMAFLLVSLIAYAYFLQTNKNTWAVLAGIAYFLSTALESFVLYFPLFIAISYCHESVSNSTEWFGRRLWQALRLTKPVAISLSLSLLAYWGWRYIHPSNYQGNIATIAPIAEIVNVVYTYSVSAIPLPSLTAQLHTAGLPAYPPELAGQELFRLESLVKALIVGVLLHQLTIKLLSENISLRRLYMIIGVSSVALFIPNMLLGLIQHHRQWVTTGGATSYLYSYYSYLAAVAFIGSGYVITLIKLTQWPKLRGGFITLAILSGMVTAYEVEYVNHAVSIDQKVSSDRWDTIDSFILTDDFKAIEDGAVIYAPTLYQGRGIMALADGYWTQYIKRKSGRNITMVATIDATAAKSDKHYLLAMHHEPDGIGLYLVLSHLTQADLVGASVKPTTKKMILFLSLIGESRLLTGFMSENQRTPKVKINGLFADVVKPNYFMHQLNLDTTGKRVTRVVIESDTPMFSDGLVLSAGTHVPDVMNSDVQVKSGFYALESGADGHYWNWSEPKAKLSVRSYARGSVCFELSGVLSSPKMRVVSIRANGRLLKSVTLGGQESLPISVEMTLPPGESEIDFSSDEPGIIGYLGDARNLAYSLADWKVRENDSCSAQNYTDALK